MSITSKEIEDGLLKQIIAIATTGRLEYHKFPPPEHFAKEMVWYVQKLLKEARIEELENLTKQGLNMLRIMNRLEALRKEDNESIQ